MTKKNFNTLEKILAAKISKKKKNFTRFWRGYLQQKEKYKNFLFVFVFTIRNRVKCKNGSNII